jgi:ASC-1-like (ASCH) protein
MRYAVYMNTHEQHLESRPFELVLHGSKTIESRLYDEKRRLIELGDEILFIHRDNPEQSITVRVLGLLSYTSFHDLFTHNDPAKFGGTTAELLEERIRAYYAAEAEHAYGVLGVEFERV